MDNIIYIYNRKMFNFLNFVCISDIFSHYWCLNELTILVKEARERLRKTGNLNVWYLIQVPSVVYECRTGELVSFEMRKVAMVYVMLLMWGMALMSDSANVILVRTSPSLPYKNRRIGLQRKFIRIKGRTLKLCDTGYKLDWRGRCREMFWFQVKQQH